MSLSTFTPHYETKVSHYQFSLSRTPPRIMTTSLIMVLPPVFVTSFPHEAIVIITIIFEIIILISRSPNLRKNFLIVRRLRGRKHHKCSFCDKRTIFTGSSPFNMTIHIRYGGMSAINPDSRKFKIS